MTTKEQLAELLELCQANPTTYLQAARALEWFHTLSLDIAETTATKERKQADIEVARQHLANRLRNILQPITSDDVTGVVVGSADTARETEPPVPPKG